MSDDRKKGWHPDPFGHYAERYYYADGEPGRLVRDEGRHEFYDDLPVTPTSSDATRVPPRVQSRPSRRLPTLTPINAPITPQAAPPPSSVEPGGPEPHPEFGSSAELASTPLEDGTGWSQAGEGNDLFPDERMPWRVLVASRLRNLHRPAFSWLTVDRVELPSRKTLYAGGMVVGVIALGIILVVITSSGPNSVPASSAPSHVPVSVPPTQPPSQMLNGDRGSLTTTSSPPATTTSTPAAAVTRGWALNNVYATSAISLTGITCPSTTQCFAVGETAFKSAMVLASIDGGNTWKQQTVRTGGSLTAMSCSSPTSCIGVGGTSVVITTDGGTTWTTRQLGSNSLTGVACPSSGTCVAVGADAPQISGCDSGVTYTTHDDGMSWSPTATHCFVPSGISCSSARQCMMSGIHTTGNANYGAVMLTGDGGKVWKWSKVLSQSNTALASISCPSDRVCVAVGNSSSQPIVRTTNAGATWSAAEPTVPGASGVNYLTVSCPSTTACQAGGLQGAVSTADGTTWAPATLPGLIIRVTGISCPTVGRCNGVAMGQLAAPWTITSSV